MTDQQSNDRQRWRPAWLLAGLMLLWMAALYPVSFRVAALEFDDTVVLEGARGFLEWIEFEWRIDTLLFAAGAIVSAVILSQDRSNRFGWILGFSFAVLPTIGMTLGSIAFLSIGGDLPTSWGRWFAQLGGSVTFAIVVGILAVLALFPTGAFHSRRFRALVQSSMGLLLLSIALSFFSPGPIGTVEGQRGWAFDNPLGIEALGWFDQSIIQVLVLISGVLVAVSVVDRYRSARSE